MMRNRVNKSRQYEMFDASFVKSDLFRISIFATGRQVLVLARSSETAVRSVQDWLRAKGLDTRIFILDSFSGRDIVSADLLSEQTSRMLSDPKLFV